MSDQITLLASTAALTVITTQAWASGATTYTTGVIGALGVTNLLFIADNLRRNRIKHNVTCPTSGCGVRMTFSNVTPAEHDRLVALAVDHSRHGGAR
jgi:hypothetical protein